MSGQATFDLDIRVQKKQTQIVGGISYSDPAAGLSFHSTKITSLIFGGNHARFRGTAKLTKKKSISFTVDINDNSVPTGPRTLDTFSIQGSTGYSASGNLISGKVVIHEQTNFRSSIRR